MLVVLVRLKRDAGQRRGASDAGGLPQRAVPRAESSLEEPLQADLTAGRRQGQEVHVVDVDVSAAVRLGVLRPQDEYLVEVLRALGAVAQHRPHGRVAVDVGVLALQVAVPRVPERQRLVDVHQVALHLPRAAAAGAVEDVGLGRPRAAGLDQHLLHDVLNLLHLGHSALELLLHAGHDALRQRHGLRSRLSHRRQGPPDGPGYLFSVKGHLAPIPLFDPGEHLFLPP